MFEHILFGLHEVEGVQATVVIDAGGNILGSHAHAIYDAVLLQQVSHSIVSAVDSVQLVQEDWELVTATYSDGKVLIRNLRPARQSRTVILAVIADGRLNTPFAGVAIRVAAAKLKAEIDAGGTATPVPPLVAPQATPTPSMPQPAVRQAAPIPAGTIPLPLAAPRADLSGSGLTWSGLKAGPAGASNPGAAGASGVQVMDDAASKYLTVCTKALSSSVGPMAKVFVKEAVRRVCADRPFSREDAALLVAELLPHIAHAADREAFQRALKSV